MPQALEPAGETAQLRRTAGLACLNLNIYRVMTLEKLLERNW